MHIFSGKARLAVCAALLSVSTLSVAQTEKPAVPDEFDKVVADGASLLAPVKNYRAVVADKSFRGTLERWSKESGWRLSWELDAEFSFDYDADFDTDFFKAVDGVCSNLNSLGVPARAVAYEGNKVIRIVPEGAKR